MRDLAPDLATGLGTWVRRLDRRLGPFPTHDAATEGEPDGYGDLSRRGTYERLLTSEWALAGSAPLEFLRRAAMGEHLFFDTARRLEQGDGRVVALFDAGVEQLGRPRIAQMAVWVALATRARRSGAEFCWGDVFDQETELRQDEPGSAAAFGAFLDLRRRALPTVKDLERWNDALHPVGDARSYKVVRQEIWWVGGESLAALAPRNNQPSSQAAHRRVCIVQPPQFAGDFGSDDQPGGSSGRGSHSGPELLVKISGSGRPVELRLPPLADGTGRRLLRHPCRTSAEALASSKAGTQIALTGDGRRLLTADELGRPIALHVPDSPKQEPGRTRYSPHPNSGTWIATSFTKGWQGVADFGDDELHRQELCLFGIHGGPVSRRQAWTQLNPKFGSTPRPAVPSPGAMPGPLLWERHGAGPEAVWWLDGNHRLYTACLQSWVYERMSTRASGLFMLRSGLAAVIHDGERFGFPRHCLMVLPRATGHTDKTTALQRAAFHPLADDDAGADYVHHVFVGHVPWRRRETADSHGLLLAYPNEDGRSWTVRFGERTISFHPGSAARVAGVAMIDTNEPALLIVEADERTLSLVGHRASRRLLKADGPIRQVSSSTLAPKIAVLIGEPGQADEVPEPRRVVGLKIPGGQMLRLHRPAEGAQADDDEEAKP